MSEAATAPGKKLAREWFNGLSQLESDALVKTFNTSSIVSELGNFDARKGEHIKKLYEIANPFAIHAAPKQKEPPAKEPAQEISVEQLFEQMKSMSSPKLVEIIRDRQEKIASIAAKEQQVLAELKKFRADIEGLLEIF